ncbi:hypothetical protein ASH00_09035 [Arthrobacter sp. Soil782]|uniref:hypothetical protein n=1 Tax=Arthrobacter sp. Soil782 TaxID=1736410 RepID=UPI000700AA6E|nr:hypothetical protein [Arthrobacter sp. Soil782]KRF05601.1 hypothetical protein ASH00_09035 [Arthrobacter sp. Soil782]
MSTETTQTNGRAKTNRRVAVVEFLCLAPLAQFDKLVENFDSLVELTLTEGITEHTGAKLSLLDELGMAFMSKSGSLVDDAKREIGSRIESAAISGGRSFRTHEARMHGACSVGCTRTSAHQGVTPEELLCLLMAALHGKADNGPFRNMQVAAEVTKNFTVFPSASDVIPAVR